MGDDNIESSKDFNSAGLAEAFQYTTTADGTINTIAIYLDSNNSATRVVGLCTNDKTTDNPSTLLTQATIASPVKGALNTVSASAVTLTSGTKYWIAVLSPTGTGTVRFRDVATGGKAQMSAQTNLTALPATWTPGATFQNSPMPADTQ